MERRRKFGIIAFLATVFLLAALFAVSMPNTSAVALGKDFSDYDRTSVFTIESQADFNNFAAIYNGKTYAFTNKTILLMTDIDMNGVEFNLSNFRGTLEGYGHAVYNLTKPLFGTISRSASNFGVVKNLDLFVNDLTGYALASSNSGVVDNVNLFGSLKSAQSVACLVSNNTVTGEIKNCLNACDYSVTMSGQTSYAFSGIANTNAGTVFDCVFTGTFRLIYNLNTSSYAAASFALMNTGTINGCVSSAEVVYENSSQANYSAEIYAIASSNNNSGSVENCSAFISTPSDPNISVNLSHGTVTNSFAIVKQGEDTAVSYASNQGILEGNESDLNSENLGEGFTYGGTYPLYNGLFTGNGTSDNPFEIVDRADAFKLRIGGIVSNYNYELKADLNMLNMSVIPSLSRFTYLGGSVNGNGFAFWNAAHPTIYGENFNLSGSNVGFVVSKCRTLSGNINDGYVDAEYKFGATEGTVNVVPAATLQGTGTADDPYLVSNAAELKALESKQGYAILINDIMLNNEGNSNNVLSIAEFAVSLNGNGHTVAGLISEPLCENLTGSITNLKLRGYGAKICEVNNGTVETVISVVGEANAGIAESNNGTIRGNAVYGTAAAGFTQTNGGTGTIEGCINYATGTYAFTAVNNGTVTRCINYGDTTYSFTASTDGTTQNSINYAAAATSTGSDGITSSFDFSATSGYYTNGVFTAADTFDYYELKKLGTFDFDTVFGYPIAENRPALRQEGVAYKQELLNPFQEYILDSYVYSVDADYSLLSIQAAISSEEVKEDSYFSWTYNGSDFSGILHNAGTYVVKGVFPGNDFYFGAECSYTYEIEKAAAPVNIGITNGTFDSYSVTYSGAAFDPSKAEVNNESELSTYGYSVSYSLSLSEEGISYCQNAGVYTQTLKCESTNYANITVERTVTVNKAELILKVGDTACDYLKDAVLSDAGLTVSSGLAATDKEKPLSDIIHNYENCFATDYVTGNNVGKYKITFTGTADNYIINAADGVLTVNSIPLPKEGISFYGASQGTDGSVEYTYTGEPIVLNANYTDNSMSVVYENNANNINVNSDGYLVTVIFSKENYIPFTLNARLYITKAELTVTVDDKEQNYGAVSTLDDVTVNVNGFLSRDTSAILDGINFDLKLYDGTGQTAVGGVLPVKDYVIKASADGEPSNYFFTFIDGRYSVKKAYLSTLYDNNNSPNTDFADYTVTYNGNAVTRNITFFSAELVLIDYEFFRSGASGFTPLYDPIINAGTYKIIATVVPQGDYEGSYLTTEYTCEITVKKAITSVKFSKDSYSFPYNATDYAVLSNFPYDGVLPSGTAPILSCNGINGEAVHAGSYVITLTVSEQDNYLGCTATAALTVESVPVTLEYTTSYDYNGSPIVLNLINVDGAINDEIMEQNLKLTFYSYTGAIITNAVNAGDYSFTVKLDNTDYYLTNDRFNFTVNRLELKVNWGELKFVYGTRGEITYNDAVYVVGDNRITRRNYRADNGMNFDITVTIPSNDVASYTLTDNSLVAATNFYFTFRENDVNRVVVERRALMVFWTQDGMNLPAASSTTVYQGLSQSARFNYSINNFAFDENMSNLNLSKRISGHAEDIYHVGRYSITVTLTDSINYYLSNAVLSVTVTKAPLYFTVQDTEIMRGEIFSSPVYTFSGTVGADYSKPADRLDGAKISPVTGYTQSSAVGAQFSVGLNASFNNYTAEILKEGTLTVIPNSYPDYSLSDVTRIYDGYYYTVNLAVADGIIVSLSNNSHRDAGTYTVTANITYPTGRQRTTSCILTILPATPAITTVPQEMVFVDNTLLTVDDIVASAVLNGVNVEGEFTFSGETTLLNGTNSYEIRFLPADTRNYNQVTSSIQITSAVIDFSSFQFDKTEGFVINEDGMEITQNIIMTLKPLLNGLELYRSGYLVSFIEFSMSDTVPIEVRYKGQKVYELVLEVTYIDVNNPSGVVIGEESFKFEDCYLTNNVLTVMETGGRIALAENYKKDYNLYVNGILTDQYVLNGNEEEISIVVRNISLGRTVFSEIYQVKTVEKKQEVKNYNYLYIIGGVVLGVAAVLGIGIFLWRKKHG